MNKRISKFDKFIAENNNDFMSKLNLFFSKFPNDATNWKYATDELRDISRAIKELNNELSSEKVEALNFKELNTPSEWNSKSKEYILDVFSKLDEYGKKQFIEYFYNYFS